MKKHTMDKAILVAAFYAAAVISTPASAQATPAASVSAPTAVAEGEVRKVDRDNRKITLRHGEIRNLDMPAMTMVFQVDDAALLDKVKPGDKVRFKASQEAGRYTVTEIVPVP